MGNKAIAKKHRQTLSTAYGSQNDQSSLPSNKKSKEILMKDVESISKKISYVRYFWAESLLEYLNTTHHDQIYAQYERVFQSNCRPDKSHEDVFLACRLRKVFLLYIPYRYNTKNTILSPEKLKQVLHEAKCYFMVMSWLQNIATLAHFRVKPSQDNQSYNVFRQEEKVYDFLVEITVKTYSEYLAKKRRQNKDFYFNADFQNSKVVQHLNCISQSMQFHDREKQIISLQQILSQDQQNMAQYLFWIQKMFGTSKTFGNLLLIREVGNINISYMWQKFYGDTYNDLFQ